ncbi:MAG: hypothetical protein KF758_03640 [Anaerolineales bacterium]|nr:hypothetical protein [Anaerolineales bacterium]MBX3035984.1 hypothetical protein [Anaerolineales bacterium]
MNQNSKTDLMTLMHPLMLLSIFVLLVNDHVLKVHFPSALTGKISDFAGLFFFPILLSAILHFVLKSFQFQSRNITFTSFCFTAIYFSLIKTVPFFNDFTEKLFSIQIILDPSDLMALIMLPLAWMLKEKVASESKTGISKLSYLVLGIASMATMATSPAFTPIIRNLIIHESIIYAEFDYEEYFFYSQDGGTTWKEVDFEIPAQVSEQIGKYPDLPFTLCLPDNKDICYQTSQEVILESKDGGQTWITSWEFPLGRKEFFTRSTVYSDLGPYDLAYIEFDGKQVVIAAMGSEGVLVKADDNEWVSIEVGEAGPINFAASNFAEARNSVSTEFQILCFTTLVFLYINVIANARKRDILTFKLLLLLPILCFFLGMIVLVFLYSLYFLVEIVSLIIFVSVLLTIFLIFEELFTNTIRQAKTNLLMIGIIIFISYMLFILWAYGIIPVYEIAQWITIILHFLLFLWILHFYLPIKDSTQTDETLSE